MSLKDCIQNAMDNGEADRERGRRAQEMWKERADLYEQQGHARHMAEALAGEDVKAAFRKEAGEVRHRFLSVMADQRKAQAEIEKAKGKPYLRDRTELLHYEGSSIYRLALSQIADYTRQINRKLFGGLTDPARQINVMREMHGESTGDAAARTLAEAINRTNEWLRNWANELGANIGKLDDWGTRHSHDRVKITKAGFNDWANDLRARIDWTRVNDPLTGRPLQKAGAAEPPVSSQMSYLRYVYDNIAFGRGSDEVVYGRPQGEALYKRLSEARVLHFKSADDWIAYNQRFGSMTPHQAIINHIRSMSEDIAAMRAFGPNPTLGLDYRAQAQIKAARDAGNEAAADKLTGDAKIAARILKVVSGSPEADSRTLSQIATFMSSVRHVLNSAFLDKAIIASLSDTNTMRLAADMIGASGWEQVGKQLGIVREMTKDDMLRAKWVVDTQADPGAAMDRWMQDVPPAGWAEQLSNTSMRIQWLSGWTDRARFMWNQTEWGLMAKNADRPLSEVDENLRRRLGEVGITADEWDALRDPETIFTAQNGSTWVVPAYWQEATSLPPEKAREIATKVQTMIEMSMERAVPTQSPVIRAMLGEGDDTSPGSAMYEIRKSGLAMKSFVMAFSRGQYLTMKAMPNNAARALYAANLVAGATAMGAISLQIGELIGGRDPMEMATPEFVARAVLKGGGLGPLGDIASAAENPIGGVAAYVGGPVVSAVGDALSLTVGNAMQAGHQVLTGKPIDTNAAPELRRMLGRYTPMGDTPIIGPAYQRMVLDQLLLAIDPDAAKALKQMEQGRKRRSGNDAFWMPGQPLPSRAPNLGAAFP